MLLHGYVHDKKGFSYLSRYNQVSRGLKGNFSEGGTNGHSEKFKSKK
jgi:hypothetical protein